VTMIENSLAVLIVTSYPARMLDSLSAGPAHVAAVLLGGLFIFLAVALLQGLIATLLSPAWGRRAALLAQMALLLVFLSPFVWFPMLFRSLPVLKAGGSTFLRYFPPFWFTGIYDHIVGLHDPVLGRAGRTGLAAVALALAAYLIVSRLCLQKFLRAAGAAPDADRALFLFPAGRRIRTVLFLRHPVQLAVFSFFMQTLRRSREHKLKLTLYLALPASFLLSQFAYLYLKKGLAGGALDSLLVSLPLALHFFLVIGMRMTAAYPHTLPANFIFRASENGPLRHYMSGFKKAMFCSTVLPPLLICLPLCLHFWGPWPAVLHALYSLAVALLLLELCLFNARKVPFAAEHVPGKFKIRFYWPVLLLGYIQYQRTFSALGKRLRDNPSDYPVFFLLVALVYALLRINQRRRMTGEHLVFEEEPDPAMLTLGLD
jgi:hypothetical protein